MQAEVPMAALLTMLRIRIPDETTILAFCHIGSFCSDGLCKAGVIEELLEILEGYLRLGLD
jgi:hypothetical protein